jgi:predicted nucleic-acid-binding protein
MEYLALDTNILINMILKRTESVTAPCAKILKDLLDQDKLKLVIPEIVKLQFQKIIASAFQQSHDFLREVIKTLDKIYIPLEIRNNEYSWASVDQYRRDAKTALERILEYFKNLSVEEQIRPINYLIEHKNTHIILINEVLLLKTFRRIIELRAPAKNEKDTNTGDCLILESLIDYFSGLTKANRAFFVALDWDFTAPNEKKKRGELHPDIKGIFDELGITYTPYLAKLLKDAFGAQVDEKAIEFELEWMPVFEGIIPRGPLTEILDSWVQKHILPAFSRAGFPPESVQE